MTTVLSSTSTKFAVEGVDRRDGRDRDGRDRDMVGRVTVGREMGGRDARRIHGYTITWR